MALTVPSFPTRHRAARMFVVMALAGLTAVPLMLAAQDRDNKPTAPPTAKEIGQQVRDALAVGVVRDKELVVGNTGGSAHGAPANPKASRRYIRAKAAALAAKRDRQPMEEIIEPASPQAMVESNWAYDGPNGPMAWGRLKPEFATCAIGQQQSPINIDDSVTLRGPAEAIVFDYTSSSATVVNNGYTIQIDVTGDNAILVRGSRFQLLQVHFHHPAEERINHRGFAMVAHLVHKDYLGRLAVVAVLLEAGEANPVINKFWTYMPLGKNDRVAMPPGSVELSQMLPKDQRYYQFMGSLTTPPCTENVLWMILKQPVTLSHAQMRLFAQQFPNNARPVQPINGRVIRDAQ